MILIFFLLLFVSCGPTSLEDYKDLGKTKTRRLLEELQKVQNRDQLLDLEEILIQCYHDIAEAMAEAERFRKTHAKETVPDLSFSDHELSDQLRFEMLRIYRLDGGKEILEKIREKGLKEAF